MRARGTKNKDGQSDVAEGAEASGVSCGGFVRVGLGGGSCSSSGVGELELAGVGRGRKRGATCFVGGRRDEIEGLIALLDNGLERVQRGGGCPWR